MFLDGFRLMAERGMRVNIYPNTPNYAPRQMRSIVPAAKEFTVRELDAAMRRHLATARLRIDEDGAPSRKRTYLAFVPETKR